MRPRGRFTCIVAALFAALSLASFPACRFFDDTRAPCEDDVHCLADEHCGPLGRCIAGTKVPALDAGAPADAGPATDAGVEPDGGPIEPDAGPRDAGPVCAPISLAAPACPNDPFDADLDADCRPDLIVGAPGLTLPPAEWGNASGPSGAVYLFEGDAAGSLLRATTIAHGHAGGPTYAGFGAAIALESGRSPGGGRRGFAVGEPGHTLAPTPQEGLAWWYDAEDDGYAYVPFGFGAEYEFAVGTSVAFGQTATADRCLLFGVPNFSSGFVRGLVPNRACPASNRVAGDISPTSLPGVVGGDGRFGEKLRRLHDFDGDGIADIGISTVGLSWGGVEQGVVATSPARLCAGEAEDLVVRTWPSPAPAEDFGAAFASLDSIDGDDTADLVVGAPAGDGGRGYVYVELSAGEMGSGWVRVDGSGVLSPGARLGSSIEPIGDLDGDGLEEVLVGAPAHVPGGEGGRCDEDPASCAGAVAVVRSQALLAAAAGALLTLDDGCIFAGTSPQRLGTALRALRRESGGVRVAVGAPGDATTHGRVYVFFIAVNNDTGACTFTALQELSAAEPAAGDRFGFALGG